MRGKDDEKIVEPMFPRLHVNDTGKGGPRAPPRNKMALYEQLSIPSQRLTRHGLLPISATSTSSLVPPRPSSHSQACGMERNLYFQHDLSSSAPVHPAEMYVAQKFRMANMRSSAQYGRRKTVGEDDDFVVPFFVNSGKAQSNARTKNGLDKENPPLIPTGSHCVVETQEASGRDLKQTGSLADRSRQEVRDASNGNPQEVASLHPLDLWAREEAAADKSAILCDRLNDSDAFFRHESRNRYDRDGDETDVKDTDNEVDSYSRNRSHSGEGHSSPRENNDHEYCRSRTCVSIQQRNGEVSDGVSETSMVDSISSTDISPDDVVELIGQQRFWKARRVIANQQSIFAVQVFELHRLIKVQRLISASPSLLLHDNCTFLGKSSSKTSPVKKILPPEYVMKPLPRAVLHKDDSEKANNHHHHHKMECSAENAVARTTTHSFNKNDVHKCPLVGNAPAPAATNAQMTGEGGSGCGGGSWCFPPQPPSGNHQWLIPVMSPSEGLIYKPYPGPGLAGSICGGHFGHFIPTMIPASGSAYGVPAPIPYHLDVGFSAPGLSYFPPYSMPAMNANFSGQQQQNEQMNQFGHTGYPPCSARAAQQQSSCKSPNAKNSDRAAAQEQQQQPPPPPTKPNQDSSKLLQGSTRSHPVERGRVQLDSSNTLHLFSTPLQKTAFPESTATKMTETMTWKMMAEPRVIKVVPHRQRMASETAIRIFRSIQEERKQHDSV